MHKNHKASGKVYKKWDIADLDEMLPHCCREDFIDFKNMKITYFQFQTRTLKAIGAKNGHEPNFVILDDIKDHILPQFYDGT